MRNGGIGRCSLLVIALAPVFAGCDMPRDPVATTRSFIRAVHQQNCEKAWRFFSSARQREIEAESATAIQGAPYYAESFSPKNLYCRPNYTNIYISLSGRSATLEEDDGKEATVSVLSETGTHFPIPFLSDPYKVTPFRVRLVREDDAWKIASISSPATEDLRARRAEVESREEEARRIAIEQRARSIRARAKTPRQPLPSAPPPADLSGNLLQNGGFTGLPPWTEYHQSNVADVTTVAVRDGAVVWERQRSSRDGGLVGVYQDVAIEVGSFRSLEICFDVLVDEQTLPNTGWWSESHGGGGELPAKVVIRYADASSGEHEWEHGFLITNEPATAIRSYDLVPASEWRRFCFDLLDDRVRRDPRGEAVLPRPARLGRVHLVGSGWDFRAAAANVVLRGMR